MLMKLSEWNKLKKELRKLPLEQELRLLKESLKRVKDKVIQEKIKEEIHEVEREKAEAREWKKTVSIPQPSRLLELAEEPPPRETPRPREEPSLETTVARAEVKQEDLNAKQREYTPAAPQEYKTTKYENIATNMTYAPTSTEELRLLTHPEYTPRAEERATRSEGEKLLETLDPLKSTETYKKKKERA